MSPRFLLMIALFKLCLSEDEGQHFLESFEDLHHLGLSITDLLEIEQLANTVSDQELKTLRQVLESLSEDQVLELADKTGEELDPSAISQFWVPDSYFHHAKDAKFIKLMTHTASLNIRRDKTIRYSTM